MNRLSLIPVILFSIILSSSFGQDLQKLEEIAHSYLQEHANILHVQSEDVRELNLVTAYQGRISKVYHFYYNQQFHGTDIYGALTGVHVTPEGEVVYVADRLYDRLSERIKMVQPAILSRDAILLTATYLGVEEVSPRRVASMKNDIDEDIILYEAKTLSRRPIPTRMVYVNNGMGHLVPAWDLSIESPYSEDWLSVRIDASTGALLDEVNWTVSCSFGDHPHSHDASCLIQEERRTTKDVSEIGAQVLDGATYNVFPIPFESPLDGSRSLVTNPADSIASPFGWHDTDFAEGPEYTITRGNNTNTFPDRDGDIQPDFEVDGGTSLEFDFAFDQSLEPSDYSNASVTNLFYTINMMHDIAYHFGFDEGAGNFQETNLSNEGNGSDAVLGLSQFDGNTGQSINNATFSTPPDGSNGIMRMFEWNNSAADQEYLQVTSPAEVAGFYAAGTADFGDPISNEPIVGSVVIAEDGIQFSTDACEPINNGDDLTGNIVLIDRGGCDFSEKVYAAQQEGAIAVIICNNQSNGIINMGGGSTGQLVDIPSIFVSREDCNELRIYAGNTLEVSIREPEEIVGAERYDGSLDNGIIAHEFAHGISNRLTGGPGVSNCLGNDEQMGEGWSDFFTLVTTVKPGQNGTEARGIGNYVLREDTDGRGIRNFNYSTDMSINPQTYEDVILSGTAPHPLGEIWCAMLWDLHWNMADRYGYNANFLDTASGNHKAIQLVMEGMALQECSPGFINGRDAILAADQVLYQGANQCLIWETFARRGLGYSADQGDPNNRRDAKEAFDLPPFCRGEVFARKEVTPNIFAGDTVTVQLTIENFSGKVQEEVAITDAIPEGCTYVIGSSTIDPDFTNAEVLEWIWRDAADQDQLNISYQFVTPADVASRWIEKQNFNGEEVLDNWFADGTDGSDFFQLVPDRGPDSSAAWFVENTSAENDQFFLRDLPHQITGSNPVLRFTHKYNTEPGTDGGIVEISDDFLITFDDAESLLFRAPYRGKLAYTTFATVNQRGFWGDSKGWVSSYIDLRPYSGDEVHIRFRFGSVEGGAVEGWTIDDFEIFDAVTYNTPAIISFDNNGEFIARPSGMGTIVEPDSLVSSVEPPARNAPLFVYPNPAKDVVMLSTKDIEEDSQLRMIDMHGRVVRDMIIPGSQLRYELDVNNIQSGLYILELNSGHHYKQTKLIVQ